MRHVVQRWLISCWQQSSGGLQVAQASGKSPHYGSCCARPRIVKTGHLAKYSFTSLNVCGCAMSSANTQRGRPNRQPAQSIMLTAPRYGPYKARHTHTHTYLNVASGRSLPSICR